MRAVNGLPPRMNGRVVNAMTVDVEDYFHAQALGIARELWEDQERRVERNTRRIMDLFAESGTSATFFILGWVAERHPALVRDIVESGHEVACHGWDHTRVDRQRPEEFRADIRRAKALIEDIAATTVKGYRAATFSIGQGNTWAFDILAEEDFAYSSSVYPIRHDYYGMPSAPRFPFYPIADQTFLEYPMTSVRIAGRNWPCSGGGYFRLLPYSVSRWAMRRVNAGEEQPCVFYFHPWEIDAGQPRAENLPLKSRVRHYTNLERMERRLGRLLADFAWDRMDAILPGLRSE